MQELILKIDFSVFELAVRQIVREELADAFTVQANSRAVAESQALRPMNMAEACYMLRLSRGAVQKLIKEGRLESSKPGNKRLFHIAAINKYLAQKK